MKNIYKLLSGKNLTYLGSIALLSFLASCSSSNQVASSWGKRKYTKGYYFNTVASVNTPATKQAEVAPPAKSIAGNKLEQTNNTPPVTASVKAVTNNNSKSVKQKTSFHASRPATVFHKPIQLITGIVLASKSAPSLSKNNISLQQSSPGSITTNMAVTEDEANAHHFGRLCLLFFLLWALFGILALVTGSGGFVGTGALFAILAGVCLILAVIFFILWIVSLA